jgi:5-methylcytosine-specific restriction endonuclease McrA
MSQGTNLSDWIYIESSPDHISRERLKALKLKKTNWWRAKVLQGLCHYCGKKINPQEITMDHIVPLCRGGRSTKGNVVACCKDCNNDKKYLTPAEIIINGLKSDLNRKEELITGGYNYGEE